MFEMALQYSPTPSDEHMGGMVPNRPLDALYIATSLPRRPISLQLVFMTTVRTVPERIGLFSER